MTAVFADSSFYIAVINPRDADHSRAVAIAKALRRPMITTEYVLVETGNWLARVGDRESFLSLLNDLARSQAIIVPGSPDLFEKGVRLYRDRPDKNWSVTDCISLIVMDDRHLDDALTADRHFQQAGYRALLLKPN